MSKITVFHLSDLHLQPGKIQDVRSLVRGLRKDLVKMKDESGITPDLFLFSGDLVQRGQDSLEAFKLVSGDVIEPLLDTLNLNQEYFFSVPGNHEVDRTKAYKEIETGLESELTSADAFSNYYSSLDQKDRRFEALAEKLAGYQSFASSYPSQFYTQQNYFSSSAVIKVGKLNVGLACLNSAWRSSHYGSGDKNRLIIGKPVVEHALSHLKDSDIKIAMCHHPFDWLAEWDSISVQRLIAREFDLLFNGHVHDSGVSLFHQTYGAFYTSTCGCLRSGPHFSHYSIVEIELTEKRVTSNLRKWYEDRGEFDQETAKANGGKIVFSNFQCCNPEIIDRLIICDLRSRVNKCRTQGRLVNPLEGIVDLSLEDVFVDPLICDVSSIKKTGEPPKPYNLTELVNGTTNLVFYGRPESGKSSLLSQIQDLIISNDDKFGELLPILISFTDLPKNNPAGITRLICGALDNHIDGARATTLLEKGSIIILIDDFGDIRDVDCSKRLRTFAEFCRKYPDIRILATMNEQIKQSSPSGMIEVLALLNAKSVFIWPFNASRIRQMLMKVSNARMLDVNQMLEQIIFYFHQLQIPVTPLAVSLFIGVLFRDSKQRNIQNEAYLIENYLESILEKIAPNASSAQLDFRDKESFLAFIARRMVENDQLWFETIDFEQEKINHFRQWGEDIPGKGVFEDFFKKGILHLEDGRIFFKFRFWLSFFLAKSMEKDVSVMNSILDRKDYLRFATALAYKAGLSRNDSSLLLEIDKRLSASLAFDVPEDLRLEFEGLSLDLGISQISSTIEEEIKNKNNADSIDANADILLAIPEEATPKQDQDAEFVDDFCELVTLHSDILRNTREVPVELKQQVLANNVTAYSTFMWLLLSEFRSLVSNMDGEKLAKLLFPKSAKKHRDERIKRMLKDSHRFVSQIVPVSVILYMTDHLGNPKLNNVVESAANNEQRVIEKLFYLLLLFKLNPKKGSSTLSLFLSSSNSVACDFISSLFLRIYAQEHLMEVTDLDKLIDILVSVRNRRYRFDRNNPVLVADTYRTDLKRELSLPNSRRL